MSEEKRAKQHRCDHHIQFRLRDDGGVVCDPCGCVTHVCEECGAKLEFDGPFWVRCTNEMCGNQGEGKGYRLFIGTSPSQIKTFRECKRKWAYGYIDRIRYPAKPEQEFGKLGHKRNENWLRDGTSVGGDDVGLVCQQGIKPHHLPTPAPDLKIEHYFEIPLFDNQALMLGYIDCVLPVRPGAPIPIIHDWKFTKDLRWAMKVFELDDDAQVAVYAQVGLELFDSDFVMARWVYFCGRVNSKSEDGRPRTPRGVRSVEQTYKPDQIKRMWQACVDDAAEIVHLRKTVKFAKDVEPNQTHCDAYGGCDHREYCPLPDSVGLGAAMAQWDKTHRRKALTQSINGDIAPIRTKQEQEMADQDLLSQLRGIKDKNQSFNGPDKEADAPAETKAEAKAEPEAKPAGDNLLADLQKDHGAGNKVNPPENKPAEKPAEPGNALAALQGMLDGTAKPTETKTEEKPAEKAETKTEEKPGVIGGALAKLQGMLGSKKPAEAEVVDKTPADAKPAETTEATTAETEAKTDKPKRARKTKAAAKGKGEAFVLALDSVAMVKNGALGDVVQLADLVAPLADAIAASHRCKEHPQGVEHFLLIEFGDGKAELAAALARYLDKTPFKGVLVVDGSSAEGSACKDVLIRRADAVIRGIR